MKLVLTALVLGLSVPAVAQAPAGSDANASKEKRVCKRVAETGSLTRAKRVCMTVSERDQIARQGKEIGRDMQTRISTEQGR